MHKAANSVIQNAVACVLESDDKMDYSCILSHHPVVNDPLPFQIPLNAQTIDCCVSCNCLALYIAHMRVCCTIEHEEKLRYYRIEGSIDIKHFLY